MTTISPRTTHGMQCPHHDEQGVTYVHLNTFIVPGGPVSATATMVVPGEGPRPMTGLGFEDDPGIMELYEQLLVKVAGKISTLAASPKHPDTPHWVLVTENVHVLWAWEGEKLKALKDIDAVLYQREEIEDISLEVTPDLDCPCSVHGRNHAYRSSPVRALTKQQRDDLAKQPGPAKKKNKK